MIHLDMRLDPTSGLWQFKITHGDKIYWSAPLEFKAIERIAKTFYEERLSSGKGDNANQFYLGAQDIIALINAGAITPRKVPPTAPTLVRAASKKARIEAELARIKMRTMSADDLLEELGL